MAPIVSSKMSSVADDHSTKIVLSKSCLSDKAITEHMRRGTVVIEPFTERHLSTSRYVS